MILKIVLMKFNQIYGIDLFMKCAYFNAALFCMR